MITSIIKIKRRLLRTINIWDWRLHRKHIDVVMEGPSESSMIFEVKTVYNVDQCLLFSLQMGWWCSTLQNTPWQLRQIFFVGGKIQLNKWIGWVPQNILSQSLANHIPKGHGAPGASKFSHQWLKCFNFEFPEWLLSKTTNSPDFWWFVITYDGV